MKTTMLLCGLLAAAAMTAAGTTAQESAGRAAPRGAASAVLLARQAEVTREVRIAAAAAQLAAIRGTLAALACSFEFDIEATDLDQEVDQFRHDEMLRATAAQLEQLIATYGDLPVANAARALLAHIYCYLGQPARAIPVLRDFDADAAGVHDILAAALAMPQLEGLRDKVPTMLEDLVCKPVPIEDKFAALYVAMRLDYIDLPPRLLDHIRKGVKGIENEAALLLEEAELVARCLWQPRPVPIEPAPERMKIFPGDPVIGAMLSATAVPVETWRQIQIRDAKVFDTSRQETSSVRFQHRAQVLIDKIAADALPGLRLLSAMPRFRTVGIDDIVVHPPGIPPVDVLPKLPDLIVMGLLHRVAGLYPGTAAADLAAAKIYSRRLTVGSEPIELGAVTITGGRCWLEDFRGKVVLIDFWSTGDPRSIAERRAIADLHRDYHDSGLQVISVSLDYDENLPAVTAMIRKYGMMAWPQIVEGRGVHSRIARAYNVDAVPARIVIGRDGKVFAIDPLALVETRLPDLICRALRVPMPIDRPAPNARTMPLEPNAQPFPIDASLRRSARPMPVEPNARPLPIDPNARALPIDPSDPGGGVQSRAEPKPIDPGTRPFPIDRFRTTTRRVGTIGTEPGPVDIDGYTGPPLTCRLEVMESMPPRFALDASVRVPSSGYSFAHESSEVVGNATHVNLVLKAPPADKEVLWVVEDKLVRVDLGHNPGDLVRVFVKYYVRDGKYERPPVFKLADVLAVDNDRLPYVGPPIRTQLYMKQTDPPTWFMIANVDVPTSGYEFKTADVRHVDDVTYVLFDLIPPARGLVVMPVLQTLEAVAELGPEIGSRIEVMARYIERTGGGPEPRYALVRTVSR